jgi:meso-butanediol dehydrogenase/(S,S)-butanediol dehydrogenase/diacetyl reductase
VATFDGKVALVTGGGRGIGRAIAARLAREGAAVGILAYREGSATTAADEIRERGGVAFGMRGDVSLEADVRGFVAAALERFRRLDVMVNNAGVVAVRPVTETSVDEWDRVLAVNLRGVFLGCREAARAMIDLGEGGRILNCSSIAGRRAAPFFSAYAASKAGVIGLTQSLSAELGAHRITVNAYCPGHITTTPMWDLIDREVGLLDEGGRGSARASAIGESPLGRAGKEEEVAALVAFLASEESSYISGAAILVDGGVTRV